MYGMEATVVGYRQGVRKRGFIYRENGSFLVKVIYRQLALNVIRIAARRKSIGVNHRDEYRFLGARFPDEINIF